MYCWAAIRPDSIVVALIQPPIKACKPKSPKTTRLPRVALPFIRPLWLFRCFTRLGIRAIGRVSLVHSLIHPDLYANVPLGGSSLGKAIINLRPQGAQRQRTGRSLFAAGHFSPAQATRELNLHAASSRIHHG